MLSSSHTVYSHTASDIPDTKEVRLLLTLNRPPRLPNKVLAVRHGRTGCNMT